MASALDFSIDFNPNIVLLVAEIEGIAGALQDFKKPLTNSVKNVMAPSIRKNFDVGGRPAWQPLSEATIARKQNTGMDFGSVLKRSGALAARAGSEDIWDIGSDEARVSDLGGDVWYGAIHQQGFSGDGSPPDIPARPFLVVQPEDEQHIEDEFEKWIGDTFRAFGWAG